MTLALPLIHPQTPIREPRSRWRGPLHPRLPDSILDLTVIQARDPMGGGLLRPGAPTLDHTYPRGAFLYTGYDGPGP